MVATKDDNWWARRLGNPQPQPQQPYPPVQYQPQPAPTYAPQYAPQYAQQGVPQAPLPQGQMHIMEAIPLWRGGQAHQTDRYPCPNCGSDHYFSRVNGGALMGKAPAPTCFTCGYNGLFQQGDPAVWQGGS